MANKGWVWVGVEYSKKEIGIDSEIFHLSTLPEEPVLSALFNLSWNKGVEVSNQWECLFVFWKFCFAFKCILTILVNDKFDSKK